MCGIVGLFAKSPEIEERLGEHLAAMLVQMNDRGPDSAGVAVYRDPAPSGSRKLTLFSADPLQDWDALARRARATRSAARRGDVGRARATPSSSSTADADEAEAWVRGRPSRAARHERRRGDRDLQGDRPAGGVRATGSRSATSAARTRSATRAWRPRAGSRPRARTRSRPATTSASCTTARSRTTTACARAAPRGHRVPDRERHRGRRRLPRLAAARGRVARAGARGLPRRPRRLLHLPRRHGGRLRRAARPDRLQAGRARRDRRLGRDGAPSGGRSRCCRAPTTRARGSPSRASSTPGRTARSRDAGGERTAVEVVDLAGRRCASSTSACTTSPATRPAPRRWRVLNPNGAHAVACGLDAELEVEIDGHVGYYCAGMNKLATVRVHGNAGTGLAENMMSGRGRRRRQREPVGRRDRPRRPARRPRRRVARAAASR